jgi:hypothetical protein
MKTAENGSILVGALILSACLSLGAGGLLLVSATWNSDHGTDFQNGRLLDAAESAMIMGVRGLRTRSSEFITGHNGSPIRLTSEAADFISMDGILVQVEFHYDNISTLRFLQSLATMPSGADTIEVRWTVVDDEVESLDPIPPGNIRSNVSMVDWRERVRKYRP